jgi:hypothetical protein
MAIGIMLHFDNESDKKIRDIWVKMYDDGICGELLLSVHLSRFMQRHL